MYGLNTEEEEFEDDLNKNLFRVQDGSIGKFREEAAKIFEPTEEKTNSEHTL